MKMSRILKVMGIGVILFLTFIVVLGVLLTILYEIQEEETKEGVIQEEGTKKETTLRVVNGTFSFCFINNGKKYYFEVLGWIKPNSTILRQYLSLFRYGVRWGDTFYGKGLILFLAVRTNLDLDWERGMPPEVDMSVAECRVGELYKECFLGDVDYALRIDNDTLLIPYVPEVYGFWESYRIAKCYENTTDSRLYFNTHNFLGLKKGDVVKIGRIVLTRNLHHDDEIDIYIYHPLPRFSIVIENVTYLGRDGRYYLFNVTLRLKDIGMVVEYSFDEFGRKKSLSEEFIPLYLLTAEHYPEELWTVETINKTHYLVAVPTGGWYLSEYRDMSAIRYRFGGGFEDVWREPQHKYIGSYASSGKSIWLKIRVFEYMINGTAIFMTPWGQMYKVNINTGKSNTQT